MLSLFSKCYYLCTRLYLLIVLFSLSLFFVSFCVDGINNLSALLPRSITICIHTKTRTCLLIDESRLLFVVCYEDENLVSFTVVRRKQNEKSKTKNHVSLNNNHIFKILHAQNCISFNYAYARFPKCIPDSRPTEGKGESLESFEPTCNVCKLPPRTLLT